MHKTTKQLVALKRILMHNEKEGMPVTALREIKILKALHHPCVLELLDMFIIPSTFLPSFLFSTSGATFSLSCSLRQRLFMAFHL